MWAVGLQPMGWAELPEACEEETESFKFKMHYLAEFVAPLEVLESSFAESDVRAAWSGQGEAVPGFSCCTESIGYSLCF